MAATTRRLDTVSADDILNAEQVGEILQTSVHTLKNWRSAGTGPDFFYAGRSARYRREAVARWVAEQEQARKQAAR